MADIERSFIFLTGSGVADPRQEAKLAALKARLAKPGAKLLLHLHGGLVDEAAGTAGAKRLAGQTPDSWNRSDDWTQVYIVWRTGVIETVRRNWTDLVHDDLLYQVILTKLIRFVARKIGIPGPAGARSVDEHLDLDETEIRRRILGNGTPAERRNPFDDIEANIALDVQESGRFTVLTAQSDLQLLDEFTQELALDPEFNAAVADLDNAVNDGLPGRSTLAPGDAAKGVAMYERLADKVQTEIGPITSLADRNARGPISVGFFILKHAGKIAYRCVRRFRDKRDHGFHATIVEELCRELYADLVGAKIWGMMTRDAREHFDPDGFGTTLLSLLGEVPQPERFVVAGHSAGSIWATHMLRAMKASGLHRPVRLVLLAPAVRRDTFAETIAEADDLVESCAMFAMNDDLERRDAVLGHDKGYIYPSSLLYCVSGMFEERAGKAYVDAPLLGMCRFADASWLDDKEKASADAISGFFKKARNAITLSPVIGICEADCHGCFDDEPRTLASAAASF